MICRMRSLIAVLLGFLLLVTGHSAAMVRGASAATDQIVICVGATTSVIYTDADGQPTVAPHICPDCLITWHAEVPDVRLEIEVFVSPVPWQSPTEWMPFRSWIYASFVARGPPVVA